MFCTDAVRQWLAGRNTFHRSELMAAGFGPKNRVSGALSLLVKNGEVQRAGKSKYTVINLRSISSIPAKPIEREFRWPTREHLESPHLSAPPVERVLRPLSPAPHRPNARGDSAAQRRIAYSLDEISKLLGVSVTLLHKQMLAGNLRVVRIGRRRLVPADVLDTLLATSGQLGQQMPPQVERIDTPDADAGGHGLVCSGCGRAQTVAVHIPRDELRALVRVARWIVENLPEPG